MATMSTAFIVNWGSVEMHHNLWRCNWAPSLHRKFHTLSDETLSFSTRKTPSHFAYPDRGGVPRRLNTFLLRSSEYIFGLPGRGSILYTLDAIRNVAIPAFYHGVRSYLESICDIHDPFPRIAREHYLCSSLPQCAILFSFVLSSAGSLNNTAFLCVSW